VERVKKAKRDGFFGGTKVNHKRGEGNIEGLSLNHAELGMSDRGLGDPSHSPIPSRRSYQLNVNANENMDWRTPKKDKKGKGLHTRQTFAGGRRHLEEGKVQGTDDLIRN